LGGLALTLGRCTDLRGGAWADRTSDVAIGPIGCGASTYRTSDGDWADACRGAPALDARGVDAIVMAYVGACVHSGSDRRRYAAIDHVHTLSRREVLKVGG